MQTLPTSLSTPRSMPAGFPLRGKTLACDPQEATEAMYYLFPPADRAHWINLAQAIKRAGVSFEDFHAWSSSGEGYESERRCRTDWNGISDHGDISPATLFHEARVAGWRPKPGTTLRSMPMLPVKPQQGLAQRVPITNAKAQEIWDQCVPAVASHAYIEKKAGQADGLRVYPESAPALLIQGQNVANWLVVPCRSDGLLQTLQFIPPVGPKLNMPGGTFCDGYHVVGDLQADGTVYVVEGVGQAWACQQATGSPAACTFGAGRMKTVAQAIARAYPNAKIVLVPDRGQEQAAETIARMLGCEWVTMPTESANNYDANDFAKDYGSEALRDLLTQVQTPTLRYKVLSGSQLSNAPPLKWTVRGLLPSIGLAGLYGPSGGGKSFLTLDLAAAIAGGAFDWFGMRVTQCPVTYCVLEGEGGMGKRIKAWEQHHGKPLPSSLRFVTQALDLTKDVDVSDLAEAIQRAGGQNGVVIIDTLNRAAPGADENSSSEMGLILAAAKQLQELVGGLVLLVHHTGKDPDKGMRGHSSLFAALDGAISVKKDGINHCWTVAKSKDDATGAGHSFSLKVITVGTDDEGDEVTSCVVLPSKARINLGTVQQLTENQQAALDVLRLRFMPPGELISKRLPFSEGIAAVAEVIAAEQKRKRERAKDAINALIEKSLISADETHLWAKPA